MARRRLEFEITCYWDGAVAPAAEHTSIAIAASDEWLEIDVDAPFFGDRAPQCQAGSTWALWEHEVVELFLVGRDGTYWEFEFGPFGHYLVLRLATVRQVTVCAVRLQYEAQITGNRWFARMQFPLSLLPSGPLRANAYAIRGNGARRRYLAWAAVPGDTPDFHRLDCFRELQSWPSR